MLNLRSLPLAALSPAKLLISLCGRLKKPETLKTSKGGTVFTACTERDFHNLGNINDIFEVFTQWKKDNEHVPVRTLMFFRL